MIEQKQNFAPFLHFRHLTHIENISQGSRVYLPVYVDRVKLSLGDIHFSQGDEQIASYVIFEMVVYYFLIFFSV
jgi:hypothetical protein